MKRSRYFLLGLLLLFIYAGLGIAGFIAVGHTVDTAQLRGPYLIQVSENGQAGSERVLAPDSPGERAVSAWLAANAGRWSWSLVTYVPGHMVRSSDFNLNIRSEGLLVLNYRKAGTTTSFEQVVRRVSEAEAAELIAAIWQE